MSKFYNFVLKNAKNKLVCNPDDCSLNHVKRYYSIIVHNVD